jgi:hypothetical protein
MADPQPNIDELVEQNKDLTSKVNSLLDDLAKEKAARVRTEKVAKINALAPDCKVEDTWSPDFLDGLAYGYAHPLSPAKGKTNAQPTPAESSTKPLNLPPGCTDPRGYAPAKKVEFDQPAEGF